MAEPDTSQLFHVVALLAAAVVAVPLFRRLGLGSVLGYLAAGVVIGPFGFALFARPEAILHVAELGVVLFLFVVGMEMRPSHLWALRRQIFGLGPLQIGACGLVLTGCGLLLGLTPPVAFIAAFGFVLTSTAIVMQMLAERGDIAMPRGQKMVSILLFEDLLIVPLLALVAFMAPAQAGDAGGSRLLSVAIAAGSLAALVAAGLFLLNPLFRLLAAARAREVMTAAALLVVLGAALLMEMGGLSMAMGAFIAGVLLSESTFRHQIEADIEPFRGLLLGLFFLAVGMSLDLAVVAADWRFVLMAVPLMMFAKALCIYVVARMLHTGHADAVDRAVLMAQGGEFAFVLYSAAQAAGVLPGDVNNAMTAVVVLSMALTPLAAIATRRARRRDSEPVPDGVEPASGQSGSVLMIGFGRFGQVVSQSLLARDVDVTIIDSDVEMIASAARFGFKVYYGDGTRLDVLHASGAGSARAIAVCVDDRAAADRIVELAQSAFPQARLLVRAYDRAHKLRLVAAGVDVAIRETFAAALQFGEAALRELDVDPEEAARVTAEVRKLEIERFELERSEGIGAGAGMMRNNTTGPQPTPLVRPRRQAKVIGADGGEPAADTPGDADVPGAPPRL